MPCEVRVVFEARKISLDLDHLYRNESMDGCVGSTDEKGVNFYVLYTVY